MKPIPLPVRYYRNHPADAPLGFTEKTMALDPAETVLLLVDVYHAAEKPEGKRLVNTRWNEAWCRIVDENLVPLVAAVRKAGYRSAVTTTRGFNDRKTDPFQLRRFGCEPGFSWQYFRRVVAGLVR